MISEQSLKTLRKMTKPEIKLMYQNLDEELRTTDPYICEICNKKTRWWNRFWGLGASYHKKCIDARITEKKHSRGEE